MAHALALLSLDYGGSWAGCAAWRCGLAVFDWCAGFSGGIYLLVLLEGAMDDPVTYWVGTASLEGGCVFV